MLTDDKRNTDWNKIEKEMDFEELTGEAVSQTLVTGDGAFKISADTEILPYPLCKFYPTDRVKYDFKRDQKRVSTGASTTLLFPALTLFALIRGSSGKRK